MKTNKSGSLIARSLFRRVPGKNFWTFLLIIFLFLAFSSPVSAAVDGFVARSIDGNYHQYTYSDLLDAYALKLLGKSNGLYEDFTGKRPVAMVHSVNGYIDYDYILDQYALALLNGRSFNIDQVIENGKAKKALMPDQVKIVSVSGGKIVRVSKNIDQALSVIDLGEAAKAVEPPEDTVTPLSTGKISLISTLLVADPGVTLARAQKWAQERGAHQRFINIAPLYWSYAAKTGLNPEILYAQSACETNFGRYTGAVPPEYNNWAGIKIASPSGDKPEDHEQFPTPEDGVRAHFNHMAAYTGLKPIGEPHDRYYVVMRLSWAGKVTAVEELSGRWAPSPTYHEIILNYLAEMK